MKCFSLCFLLLLISTLFGKAAINIVAAENFYGGVAEQIGGPAVKVVSILTHPNQDPHEFQADAAIAKLVTHADIVIFNGIGYDDWMERLLRVTGKPHRVVLRVADLVGAKNGADPHIWYDPETISTLATKLAQVLDRPQAAAAFYRSMQPLYDKITVLKSGIAGTKVTATEPLFGYMASALGLVMLNYDYQLAMMNDTDPNFTQIANFEKSLTTHTAKVLFFNSQVTSPSTRRMQDLASKHQIPVIGITETQPPDAKSYVDWMLSELSEVEKAFKMP